MEGDQAEAAKEWMAFLRLLLLMVSRWLGISISSGEEFFALVN